MNDKELNLCFELIHQNGQFERSDLQIRVLTFLFLLRERVGSVLELDESVFSEMAEDSDSWSTSTADKKHECQML